MTVAQKAKNIIAEQGRTQTWVISKMNEINPSLNLNSAKFSAMMSDSRKMSGDEFLAFCRAVKVNPNVFME